MNPYLSISSDGRNYLLLILSAVLIFLPIIMSIIKKRYKNITVIEQEPPDGFNPAEVGYAVDCAIQSKDLTSLIYYWASHGHLRIEITGKKSFTLYKGKPLDETHKQYERLIYDYIWTLGGVNPAEKRKRFKSASPESLNGSIADDRRQESYTRVYSTQLTRNIDGALMVGGGMLRSSFEDTGHALTVKWREKAIHILNLIAVLTAYFAPALYCFVQNTLDGPMAGFIAVGMLLSAVFVSEIWIHGLPEVITQYDHIGRSREEIEALNRRNTGRMAITVFGGMMLVLMLTLPPLLGGIDVRASMASLLFLAVAVLFRKLSNYRGSSAGSGARVLCAVAAWGFGLLTAALYVLLVCAVGMELPVAVVLALCVLLAMALNPNIRAATEYGAYIRTRCSGFRQFLATAERSRIEMLLEDNPDYYYDILPYAHALNVSEIWMEKCRDIPSVAPDWVYGAAGSSGDLNGDLLKLITGLEYDVRRLASAATAEPPGNGEWEQAEI